VTAVVICNWRDLQHPEAGGSEHTVETIARILAADGHPVTILCAKVAGHPADEIRDGVRYLRAGGRFGVYLRAAWALLSRQVRPDVVLDVQNGPPWLSRLEALIRPRLPRLLANRAAAVLTGLVLMLLGLLLSLPIPLTNYLFGALLLLFALALLERDGVLMIIAWIAGSIAIVVFGVLSGNLAATALHWFASLS